LIIAGVVKAGGRSEETDADRDAEKTAMQLQDFAWAGWWRLGPDTEKHEFFMTKLEMYPAIDAKSIGHIEGKGEDAWGAWVVIGELTNGNREFSFKKTYGQAHELFAQKDGVAVKDYYEYKGDFFGEACEVMRGAWRHHPATTTGYVFSPKSADADDIHEYGTYWQHPDREFQINGKPVYTSHCRILAWSGATWVITGMQYLSRLKKGAKEGDDDFVVFASGGTGNDLTLNWHDYDVKKSTDTSQNRGDSGTCVFKRSVWSGTYMRGPQVEDKMALSSLKLTRRKRRRPSLKRRSQSRRRRSMRKTTSRMRRRKKR